MIVSRHLLCLTFLLLAPVQAALAADPKGADFSNAWFNWAWFAGAKLDGANFTGAKMLGAQLQGADLSKVVGLSETQLRFACSDSATRLPPGIATPRCPF